MKICALHGESSHNPSSCHAAGCEDDEAVVAWLVREHKVRPRQLHFSHGAAALHQCQLA